ncbi:MAG: hypothetical protein D6689_07390 [Deltaproteobacteria bacterium]|nr:MAG: hypothetical protein D6689_07390 [Deltaproteobacteria bacterium]
MVFTKDGDEWICTIEIPGGLAAYGFRRGEVGCRFKQVGPGRYEGEILWRDRAGNASWKHTVATVTGDTYEDTTGHDECTRYWRRLHGEFVTAELVGFWTGDWGDMVLREVGDEVWGAYRHDDGTVVLRWDADDVLRGWWSEAPSRNPDQDAGEVEFRFARDGDAIVLDGRWRYGTSGAWREDWDLRRSPQAPPADLESRFAHPELFKRRP